MSDGHKLAMMMREAGKTPQNEVVDLVEGQVISVNPLKVKVDQRELTETFLIVGALCKETHIFTDNIIKHNHVHPVPSVTTSAAGEGPHTHTVPQRDTNNPKSDDFDIMLWRGLKVGDIVLMLKVARGQKYYIMQRKEGVIPT